MNTKHWLSIGITALFLINLVEIFPITEAPLEDQSAALQASLLSAPTDSTNDETAPLDDETTVLLSLLEQYVEQERNFPKAIEVIEQNPQSSKKILELYRAKIVARSLNFEEAVAILNTLENKDIGLLKAIVLIASGDRAIAESYLHELIAENIDAYTTSRALALLNIYHEFDLHLDSDMSYLWTLFAQKLGSLAEYEIALFLTEKAIEKNPGYRDAWLIKGYNEYQLGRWTDAEHSLLSAHDLDPGNHQIQYLLGLVYFGMENHELSTQFLLYAQQNTSPYQGDILEKLGLNAMASKEYALSQHYFLQLLELVDGHQNALTQLVWINGEPLNKLDDAFSYATRLTEAHPADPNSYQLLSWVHSKRGDLDKADAALSMAKKLQRSAPF